MTRVRVGAFLPTFCGPDGRSGDQIAAFARRAEELGFDSLWATDHLLHGSLFYAVPWLEPLVALTYAAAATSRIALGTSILVMPTRNAVVLAKQIATLQALSGDRFVLGAGTGWDAREFEAAGGSKRERGARTDEAIDIVSRLVRGERVSLEGRFHRLRDVEIGPPMRSALPVWVAGGRQLPHERSPEPPRMAPRVLKRIARADGWISRPTALPQQIEQDRHEIEGALPRASRDRSAFTFAHENFLHFVPSDDPATAMHEQRRAFIDLMGTGRPFDYFEQVYLTGTREDVLRKLEERLAAGIEYLILHTLEPSTRQLELWAEHVLPRVAARP